MQVYPFGVNPNYCYGYFLWNLGIRIRKIRIGFKLVLLRIQGLGFKDPTLWPFFAGERKSGSSGQRFESLLPGKKHPKLPEISQIWATFGTNFVLAVLVLFCAFIC
jgi:hypothetical protein